MANEKLTARTELTAPTGSDVEYAVIDPTGTPLSRKIYRGSNNIFADGVLKNGIISVTVVSNDLVVALKTKSGGNPSATDPVSVWINGTFRRCTAALSVTKADGTNWANLGSAEHGGLEHDLFAYLVYNTNTAALDIFWSRNPRGLIYSDFSATTTNENYAAINATAPASTDSCVVIGRFAATLSLVATSYLFTVPTFTNKNLIQYPIFETRWLSWTPIFTNLTTTSGTLTAQYLIDRKYIYIELDFIFGASSAITAAGVSFTLPYTNASSGAAHPQGMSSLVETGTGTTMGSLEYTSSTAMRIRSVLASGTYATFSALNTTVPFTWGNTDEISSTGKYRY